MRIVRTSLGRLQDGSSLISGAGTSESILHSCSHCRKIEINIQDVLKVKEGFRTFMRSKNVEKLLTLHRECHFFRLVLGNLESHLLQLQTEADSRPRKRLRFGKFSRGLFKSGDEFILQCCYYFDDFKVLPTNVWGVQVCSIFGSEYQRYYFGIEAEHGTPAADRVLSRPVNRSFSSGKPFQDLHRWLQRCLDSHSQCSTRLHHSLPTRVLDITDVDRIRLCNTDQEPPDRYAALSYCWGTGMRKPPVSTTKETLCSRMAGIKMANLPRTLQDAVTTARALGLSFIWIDCLCIIQNDPEDLVHELGLMSHIYKGAFITIVAGSARSCDEGFLGKQNADEIFDTNQFFNISFRPSQKQHSNVILKNTRPGHEIFWKAVEPVQERGWTFQEHLLSHRLVLFNTQQISWVCAGAIYHDGGPYLDATMPPVPFVDDLGLRETETRHSRYLWNWEQIVHEYSRRKLSHSSDKLLALAAVAEEYARIYKLEPKSYLAGLWKDDFPRHLLWTPYPQDRKPRPATYRAPSFSWASVDSRVTFEVGISDQSMYAVAPLTVRAVSFPKVESLIFGEVLNAQLTCHGLLKMGNMFTRERDTILSFEGFQKTGQVWPDITWPGGKEVPESWKEVLCLLVQGHEKPTYQLVGLVLSPTGTGGFQRLGLWFFSPGSFSNLEKWFDGVDKRSVVLE
ncbi:HET-domain-containing protein [Trichodelitschia bisporula]|uniref:HET-domain-containing protein n=1 Tax=Trichodelitschia bisporula TaxID=703511 RepID=A0A6G1HJ28_9PEZI|nr:HET-domain-containing protein [Trichodelitschia bisporula]